MRESGEVWAIENQGFRDCVHGRSGSTRQVLVMDAETLEEFGIAPGRARENITTRGIAVASLARGQRLRIGDAVLEVTKWCTPCHQMDEIREGLQDAIRGRRGVLCRVVESGRIRCGDRIDLEGNSRAERLRGEGFAARAS